MFCRLLLIFALLSLVGCSLGSSEPETSAADAAAVAAGVGRESQVRFLLTEELRLDALDLEHTGDGNFNGRGTGSDGVEYDIEIEQQPGKVLFTWTNSKGKKGKGNFTY